MGTERRFSTSEQAQPIPETWRTAMDLKPRIHLVQLRKTFDRTRVQFGQEIKELRAPAHSAKKLAAAFAVGTFLSFIPIPLLDTMLVGMILTRTLVQPPKEH